ncbi:HPr-rel-A system PqqD family peptide chaperone [Sphingomonas sp. CBMAI 2297]|uniref:HPr-rel-A system PqqD family peptide chaperone n=1 Tax=Sphingomonas sp. CBMAI 2297 TaxID=2991720 RepID=UPI002454E2CE|nr:HPr-rel-A system PqqD family peptide chaperone [Sphingomonas sp. CBMAI 2297]MDH4742943.1 HPr-rel-A system PqqD family peptide chaperone [Sphingomonas sp. CBMAI 2297]
MTAYRAAPPETLRIVPLDALTLIYHRASGITHVVDAPVPEMLEALAADELTVDQLLARLAERYDLLDADPAALAMRLDELVQAGLVERL